LHFHFVIFWLTSRSFGSPTGFVHGFFFPPPPHTALSSSSRICLLKSFRPPSAVAKLSPFNPLFRRFVKPNTSRISPSLCLHRQMYPVRRLAPARYSTDSIVFYPLPLRRFDRALHLSQCWKTLKEGFFEFLHPPSKLFHRRYALISRPTYQAS